MRHAHVATRVGVERIRRCVRWRGRVVTRWSRSNAAPQGPSVSSSTPENPKTNFDAPITAKHFHQRPFSRRAPCHALPTLGPDTWHMPRLIHTSGHCNTLVQKREQKSGEHHPTAGRCRSAHQEPFPRLRATGRPYCTPRGARGSGRCLKCIQHGAVAKNWPCSPTCRTGSAA